MQNAKIFYEIKIFFFFRFISFLDFFAKRTNTAGKADAAQKSF